MAQKPYFSMESNAGGAGEACETPSSVYQWAVLPDPIKGEVLTIDCHISMALISLWCDTISAHSPGSLPDGQGGAERQWE